MVIKQLNTMINRIIMQEIIKKDKNMVKLHQNKAKNKIRRDNLFYTKNIKLGNHNINNIDQNMNKIPINNQIMMKNHKNTKIIKNLIDLNTQQK